jgi:ferredoxin
MISQATTKTTLWQHISPVLPVIRLDTRRCRGCGKCVRVCPQGVLGMVDLPFHRHAWIELAEKCTGCMLCVKACPHRCIQIGEGQA